MRTMNIDRPPLPVPGLVWGPYPLRSDPDTTAPRAWPGWLAPLTQRMHARARALLSTEALRELRARQAAWSALDADDYPAHLAELRARLARDGWAGARLHDALGCVASAGAQALGRVPFDTQLQAAAVLLNDQLAEMATGEGKTYAAALAAAVAALAGVPVHVLTANDYLVERDASWLQPLFERLGLSVGVVLTSSPPEARRAAYACHLTYATAREIAFDHLRDRLDAPGRGAHGPLQAQTCGVDRGANTPLLRGLCMAVLDEADSLLIDEAGVPLVLSQTQDDPQVRAACFQALALARQLRPGPDFTQGASGRPPATIRWTEAGMQHLEDLSAGLGGAWINRRHRQDLVSTALEALHLLRRDQHYLVREGRVELLDAQTGRIATGRVWSRSLQTLVELKEGCTPTPATAVRAQISFPRLFSRYLRLCGMSGTVAECRRELRGLYQREVVVIPLRLASQRRLWPERLYADAARRRLAVAARAQALRAQGRPVLIGTDSVLESEQMSQALSTAGVPHRVLNARHDHTEADIIAQAGQAGTVTVATQMAGRGTDITLGPGVAEVGGLHVLCCQDGTQVRLERQLIGRCARQGDPGSAEIWRQVQAPALAADRLSRIWTLGRKPDQQGLLPLPAGALRRWVRWVGNVEYARQARQRRRLIEQERVWHSRLEF